MGGDRRCRLVVLPELLAWFSGNEQNRRKFQRKRKPYRAVYSARGVTQRPAIGIDISGGGLCVITQEPLPPGEVEMRAQLDERAVRMRVQPVWQDNVQHQGRKVWRYGLRYTGIPADDWDAIVRYASGGPVNELNRAQEELATIRLTDDDVARLLPLELQRRLLGVLVERGRLAPLDPRLTPLVQYFYSGVVRNNEKLVHRLVIQSRMNSDEASESFETRFIFDENGQNVQALS